MIMTYSKSQARVDEGTLSFTIGIFNKRTDTFITDFFSYEDIKENRKEMKLKRFAIPQELSSIPDLYLVGMVMLVDTTVEANKCQGVGVLPLDQFFNKLKKRHTADALKERIGLTEKGAGRKETVELPLQFTRNHIVSIPESIKRIIDEGKNRAGRMKEEITLLESTFHIKKVDRFRLNPKDFVFEKTSDPTLHDRHLHKFILTIDVGKFTGKNTMFGDSFEISLDVEILDDEGALIECIKTTNNDKFRSQYKAATSPNNTNCVWKENIHIELKENWKYHQVRFNFSKHQERQHKKAYGFAFMKLCSDKGVFVSDGNHSLNVFQIHSKAKVDVADYIDKPFEVDKNRKEVKSLNHQKYSLYQNDSFNVKTKLISTQITDDAKINDLLELPGKMDKVEMTLTKFSHLEVNPSKRILFLTDILNVLWKVIEEDPKQEKLVFDAFVQTIHPIITNKTDFGYALEFLERYIEEEFTSSQVYDPLVNAFEKMLGQERSDFFHQEDICKYALMSMKIISKFIVTAYLNANAKGDGSMEFYKQEQEKFYKIIDVMENYMQKEESKEHHMKAFKAFFEVENVEILNLIISNHHILKVLGATLESLESQTDAAKYKIVIDLLNSKLFYEETRALVEIATKLIESSIPRSHGNDCPLNDRTKATLLPLVKTLYGKIKTLMSVEKQELMEYIVERILPLLIKITPKHPKRGSDEDILLFAFLCEVDMVALDKLSESKDFPLLLNKLFEIIQNQTDTKSKISEGSFISELSYEFRVKIFYELAKVLDLISDTVMTLEIQNNSTNITVINNMFLAIASIASTKEVMFYNLNSIQKRNKYLAQYGDIQHLLCSILQKSVVAIFPDKMYYVLSYYPHKIDVMEAIFTTSLEVKGESREIAISLLLSCIDAEFFETGYDGKMNKNISLTYSWFISRIIKSFRNINV